MSSSNQGKPRFIRKNGRIIPIGVKSNKSSNKKVKTEKTSFIKRAASGGAKGFAIGASIGSLIGGVYTTATGGRRKAISNFINGAIGGGLGLGSSIGVFGAAGNAIYGPRNKVKGKSSVK